MSNSMTSKEQARADWPDLEAELSAWVAEGQRARFWWRDDDAVEPTPALERLLGLGANHGCPLALAVIPARARKALAERLAERADVALLQHGFAHRNHAGPGEKKQELGAHRPIAQILEEVARGQAAMDRLFAGRWLPVMVPPWNRIDRAVAAELPALGFRAISGFGPAPTEEPASSEPSLPWVNCELDFLRWKPQRGFLGEAAVLALLARQLRSRRSGDLPIGLAIGILSHHSAHNEAAWRFLERLVSMLSGHKGASWITFEDAYSGLEEEARDGLSLSA
jgi:hypothetical protein